MTFLWPLILMPWKCIWVLQSLLMKLWVATLEMHPLILLLWRCVLEMHPVTALCVALIVCLIAKLVRWVHNWWRHFQLANLISDWHRDELNKRMRAKGLKP